MILRNAVGIAPASGPMGGSKPKSQNTETIVDWDQRPDCRLALLLGKRVLTGTMRNNARGLHSSTAGEDFQQIHPPSEAATVLGDILGHLS